MSDRQITFEMLNTYVDGELDATAAAEIVLRVIEILDEMVPGMPFPNNLTAL